MKAAVVDTARRPETIYIKEVPVSALPSNHVLIALRYVDDDDAGSIGPRHPV
jgi:NADPH:quinone reductase-like Zn-dependent oxidoreductase